MEKFTPLAKILHCRRQCDGIDKSHLWASSPSLQLYILVIISGGRKQSRAEPEPLSQFANLSKLSLASAKHVKIVIWIMLLRTNRWILMTARAELNEKNAWISKKAK